MSRPLQPIAVDLAGTRAVVTGASSGIGKEVALGLARLGADVVLCGRSEARLRDAVDDLAARGARRDRLHPAVADLARVAEARRLGDELLARLGGVEVLVNNAGCYCDARRLTPEGFEETWATNVLAYEALTDRLQPSLEERGGRIVYVASARAGRLDLDDLAWTRRRWSGVGAYEQSKQANRMLAWARARRLTRATLHVAHPGGVATNIAGRQRGLYGLLARLAFRTQRSPARGADTPLWLAASPELAGAPAGFWFDRAPRRCRWRDAAACEAVWARVQAQLATVAA